jgi:DNA-directed RNA polymerase subunit RPC12/RpoP
MSDSTAGPGQAPATGMGQDYVQCPGCRVRYPLDRLYADPHDGPAEGKSYTVLCAVCGRQFEIGIRTRWSWRGRTLRAVVKG